MPRRLTPALVLAGIVALAGVGGTHAAPAAKSLSGRVGPGFTISVSKARVSAGTFTITIRDRSRNHSFVLAGPGVSRRTSVAGRGTTVWRNVRLQKGKTYRFYCARHPSTMKGTFRSV